MLNKNQKGFGHLLLLLAIVIVGVVIGFIGLKVYDFEGGGGPSGLATCQGTNLFSVSPAASGTYDYIEPLGHTSGSVGHILPVDHMYFYFKHSTPGDMESPSIPATVQAPASGEIYRVVSTDYETSGTITNHDYQLYFASCKGVYVHFEHVNTLSPAIQSVLNKATSSFLGSVTKNCQKGTSAGAGLPAQNECKYNVNIKLNAGDHIGTAGGPGVQTQAFDFGVYNTASKPLPFIDTSYMYKDGLYAVCGISYYPNGPVKTILYSSLKTTKVDANGQKDCGTNLWDKAGTIQGDWHLPAARKGQNPDNQYGLSIIHYDMDPSQATITWGGTIAPANNFNSVIQTAGIINRDPADITADGKVYCYEDKAQNPVIDSNGNFQVTTSTRNSVYVQLVNTNTLKVQYHQGTCPANPELSNPTTYER